ncbi:hemerythrin domain-containing protein [Glaciecola sp. 1036]|uniref:hemerythrin domain-containing protein n=1 Tax=Alteromonadaceae TaxID=72275 RepID=UPI003D006BD4
MKIFEALRQDHDKQRALMKALIETQGNSAMRADFYEQLKHELNAHAIAEERHFYKPLIDQDRTIELSRHGIAEHHEIDEIVEQLDEIELNSPAWLNTMKKLQHKVLHHLEEEEQEFFQQAGKVLSNKEKENLADQYVEEMEMNLEKQ